MSDTRPETVSENPSKGPSGAPAPTRSPAFTPRHAIINGFIVFNLLAILCTAVPPISRVVTNVKIIVEPYLILTGLHQVWAMFSPDPPTYMNYLEAEVTYADGKTTLWKFPIPSDYGYYRAYFMERYRKWSNDYVRMDSYSAMWPDACHFVARANNTRGVPPDTVRLIRRWAAIPPLDSAAPDTPPKWERYPFYTCAIKAGDLK